MIITPTGVEADPSKVSAIMEMPYPINGTALRKFLGMFNWLRPLIPNASDYTAPFDALVNHKGRIHWSDELRSQFNRMKQVLSENISMARFDPAKEVVMGTDSSDVAVSAFVAHRNENGE